MKPPDYLCFFCKLQVTKGLSTQTVNAYFTLASKKKNQIVSSILKQVLCYKEKASENQKKMTLL